MERPQSSATLSPRSSGSTESIITRYGARHWAVYVNGELLAVTLYKKGALAVQEALLSRTASAEKGTPEGAS